MIQLDPALIKTTSITVAKDLEVMSNGLSIKQCARFQSSAAEMNDVSRNHCRQETCLVVNTQVPLGSSTALENAELTIHLSGLTRHHFEKHRSQ